MRIEIGPKDIENNSVLFVRRDNLEKITSTIAEAADIASLLLQKYKTIYLKVLNNAYKIIL